MNTQESIGFSSSLLNHFISEMKQNLPHEPDSNAGRPKPKSKPRTTVRIDTRSPVSLFYSPAF
jgi:hypothetical protein